MGGIIDKLFPQDHKSSLAKIKTATEAEKKVSAELRELLDAKQELARIKFSNNKLRKDIAAAGDSNAELRSRLPTARLKH
jgi:hypothetical protein